MIICAAIKLIRRPNMEESLVVCGLRHCDCFKTIHHLEHEWREDSLKIQGFINHKGEFLDRKQALAHAQECGQLNATTRWYQQDHNIDELYSEDLY